jgi:hypothetical protein
MDVLVLGLDHWIQRQQDADAERNQARQSFERDIRGLIDERGVTLVAEEAGNDDEVAEGLQRQENVWAGFENRGPRRIEPVETIARTITRPVNGCDYVDIRPAGEWPDPGRPEYERAMLNRIRQNVGNANSVLVLCGEFHRQNIAAALLRHGWNVESRDLDWVLRRGRQ